MVKNVQSVTTVVLTQMVSAKNTQVSAIAFTVESNAPTYTKGKKNVLYVMEQVGTQAVGHVVMLDA
jgi:hypothetical protein